MKPTWMHGPDAHRGVFQSERAVVLLSALIVTIITATAGFAIWHNRQSALNEHRRDMGRTGFVLAEQTSRYVQVVDLITREVQAHAATMNIETPGDFRRRLGISSVQAYLSEHVKNVPQADAVVLVDADGLILNSSRPGPVFHADETGQDYFSYFKEHNDPGLFIGSSSSDFVTNATYLFFARRVSTPDGEFLGAVVGIMDTKYMSDFYGAASEDRPESVTLSHRDGTILFPRPSLVLGNGTKIPQESPWFKSLIEGGGSYTAVGVHNSNRSLVSVHPLRDYPLVIGVVLNEAIALASWRKEAAYIAGFALVAICTLSSLLWMLARHVRHQAEQNARLEDAAITLSEGQQTLLAYAEMSADWFWEQDADFRFKHRTAIPFMSASDDTGKTRWELAGAAMTEERWASHKADLAARRPFRDFRWERIDKDGERHFITISGDPVFDRNGTFTGYRGTGREITAEVRVTAELERERQQFQLVLENMVQGITFFDADQKLIISNRKYNEMYRLSASQTRVGTSLSEILAQRLANGTLEKITPAEFLTRREALSHAKQPYELVDELRDGRTIVMHYQPLPNGGWLTTHEDITDRRRGEEQLVFMARHDALTRLPNRVLFQERLEQALEMTGRGSGCAVLCLDLDRFKLVNDTLGHPVGDGLLRAAANKLQACVREGDLVARLGGDEFAIIQLAVQRPEDVELLANRIIAAFEGSFEIDGHIISVGTSIGVAMAPGDATSSDKLLKHADIALYLAKTEGRSRIRFFEPEMDASIHLRRMLELDLQGAVGRNELELYYQPLVNLLENTITGFEALLRWHHPSRGMIPPADFIPLAEETGMIVALGEWVLHTACVEAKRWPETISVAVNLSSMQFKRGHLVNAVKAALDASGLQPSRLELEITESVLMQDVPRTMAALHQLRAMGIAIALDDFGTGYSSLSYLRSFPFDKIKIDQSFVHDLVEDKESMAIIRAVTGLGRNLRMRTTAEGVETQEQLDKLREEGCTEVQGYFFSIPRPANELPSLIQRLQRIGHSTML